MIKVSFIVIGYNIEQYIQRCLESILAQTLYNIEIIVVDDGSIDRTLELAKEIIKDDSRVNIISQKNKGANEARKIGLRRATGEYVVFIDGDDWVENKLAEDLYNIAEKNSSDIVCSGYYIKYDNKPKIRFLDDKYNNIQGDTYLKLILEQKITHNLCNKFIKKSYIDKTSFNKVCGTSMGEDLAGNVVLGIGNPNVVMVSSAYYYYYQRNTSTMNKASSKLLEIETALNYIENILKEANVLETYQEQVDFLWFIHCYFSRVVSGKLKIDENHRKLYCIWKNKNINLKNNKCYKEYMKKINIYRKIIKLSFDFNYNFGALILKIEHKIRGIKYS